VYDDIESVQEGLFKNDYIANRDLATIIYLSLKLRKPLFLEGEAGVGKTEVAKVLGKMMEVPLIRLQCYEGLDVHNAVYEWDYPRQILHLRMLEADQATRAEMEKSLYSREFLLARPLLQAIDRRSNEVPVLLIDEIDRADEEFESFLLELLSDFQITIPEIGTIHTDEPPIVIITSNRTREVHDALKRRCLYQWIDYPSFETEYEIVQIKVPGISEMLSRQIVAAVQKLRQVDLYATLGVLLKYQDDVIRVKELFTGQLIDETSAP
jgi:MoxR-like ATPase